MISNRPRTINKYNSVGNFHIGHIHAMGVCRETTRDSKLNNRVKEILPLWSLEVKVWSTPPFCRGRRGDQTAPSCLEISIAYRCCSDLFRQGRFYTRNNKDFFTRERTSCKSWKSARRSSVGWEKLLFSLRGGYYYCRTRKNRALYISA
jgi:hypothetical protein